MADTKTAPSQLVNKNGKPSRKQRTPIDPNETKAQRFVRLANVRVARLIKVAGYVGNLANQNQYESTDEQRAKLVAVVLDAANAVKVKFSAKIDNKETAKLF